MPRTTSHTNPAFISQRRLRTGAYGGEIRHPSLKDCEPLPCSELAPERLWHHLSKWGTVTPWLKKKMGDRYLLYNWHLNASFISIADFLCPEISPKCPGHLMSISIFFCPEMGPERLGIFRKRSAANYGRGQSFSG